MHHPGRSESIHCDAGACDLGASRSFSLADFEKEAIMAMPTRPRESGFKTNPDYRITFEASPRRVRVRFNGEIIADSTNAHLLFETRHLPVYYFPRSDVRIDLMAPTDHHSFCPYKGTASYR